MVTPKRPAESLPIKARAKPAEHRVRSTALRFCNGYRPLGYSDRGQRDVFDPKFHPFHPFDFDPFDQSDYKFYHARASKNAPVSAFCVCNAKYTIRPCPVQMQMDIGMGNTHTLFYINIWNAVKVVRGDYWCLTLYFKALKDRQIAFIKKDNSCFCFNTSTVPLSSGRLYCPLERLLRKDDSAFL